MHDNCESIGVCPVSPAPTFPVPMFPVSDFALETPQLGTSANILGMQAAGWVAVGLNRLLGSRAHGRAGIVTYHRVSPHFANVPVPTHNVAPERFRAQIRGLLDGGFTIWPLRKLLLHRTQGAAIPPRTIAITFDDGFQSVYTHAWPVLREFNVPASIFLTTAYLNGLAPFPFDTWGLDQRDRLPGEAYRPLTIDQCREMADSGSIELGAHTHTHRDMRDNPELFREDLQTSVDIVRRTFALDAVAFAFPYGAKHRGFASPDLVTAAKLTGVSCGLTTDCSLVDLQTDPFEWGRFNAFEWDTSATLAAKLEGWYTWAAQLKRVFVRPDRTAGSKAAKRGVSSLASPQPNSAPPTSLQRSGLPKSNRLAQAHVVSLVNILAPYERPVYLELARRVGRLTILLSSPRGLHGIDTTDWDSLDVRVQRTWTLRRPQRHPLEFDEKIDVHIPWNTMSELAALKPDVVIAHETGIRSMLSAFYARRRDRVPLVLSVGMTEHTERGRGWARHLLRRWLFRTADAVAVNGPGTGRYVGSFGVAPDQMFHTPYVALKESKADVPATREPAIAHHLLYVGQFVERKGLLPFIVALGRWAANHPTRYVEFSLVGSGPLEDAIRSVQLPKNLSLHLLGRRKPEEIAQLYGSTGIFVLPTLADEWGLVVNEAMASGLPVLGSVYSQAVNELCSDGAAGWTFRTDDPAEAERAIDAAMSTPPDKLDVMRAAARERVEHLTAEYVVDQMEAALEPLLRKYDR